MTTTRFAVPGRPSSNVNVRPKAGLTRRTSKKFWDTTRPASVWGWSCVCHVNVRLTDDIAAIPSNERALFCHASKTG